MNYIETIKTVCMFLHMAVLTKSTVLKLLERIMIKSINT